MRTLRWTWPMILIGIILLAPWACYSARPRKRLDVVVLDKTVPFNNRIEHRSLFWLLEHLKIERPAGGIYGADRDYLGAFPGPNPGDPPARTTELTRERASHADLIYLADTYGVYRDDLLSGRAMKAALERSPKIYGGLDLTEAEAAADAVAAGKTLVAEFNTLGSPTEGPARQSLERTLGVTWSRWIGRFFARLEDRAEVLEWMRRDYENEWRKPWVFAGPGYVLTQDDTHCEVLRMGPEVEWKGLTLEREEPADALLRNAETRIPYPYWFDVIRPGSNTRVLASFQWHLSDAGRKRLGERGLPIRFAAVTRHTTEGHGPAYYFAGDFADNPMAVAPIPLAGYPTMRKWFEKAKLSPSETAFYWCFYAPMMTHLLEGMPSRPH